MQQIISLHYTITALQNPLFSARSRCFSSFYNVLVFASLGALRNYDAAADYLTMQHDEFTNKPVLDEHGEMMPRDFFLPDGINCDPFSFNQECQSVNAQYGKNQTYGEIKAHHYIVSFDPNDRDENGLTPERSKPIRGRKLGTDFEKEFIENFFRQKAASLQHPAKEKATDISPAVPEINVSRQPHARPQPSIRLNIDIQTCIRAQENSRYAQKVKIGNLQEAAKTLAFLQENGIGTKEELASLLTATKDDQQSKHDELLSVESRLKTVNQMIRLTGQYYANKDVYGEFLKAKKNALYEDYSTARAKYRELQTIDANVKSILGDQELAKEAEKIR